MAIALVAGGLLLVQLLLLHHAAALSFAPPPPTLNVDLPPGSPLVRSTCNSTSFYDLCVVALASDPSSSNADVPGLCIIALSAAAANASATVSFLAPNNNNDNASEAEAERVLLLRRSCAAEYRNARDALLAARASVAQAAYDYALVHVSAAAEYPAVCRTLFRRRASSYPAELAKREEGLRRLCTIVRDIISLLLHMQQCSS